MDTPVALTIFNRPDQLRQAFEQIRLVKPKRLFVIADGPRPNRAGEAERCAAARSVTEQIDWDCTVERNYAERNMGCGRRLSCGFDWLFSRVDRAIIIEDDCVPDVSFFHFCDELLERYRDDDRVMHITGRSHYGDNPPPREYDYYFSHQHNCWGWATWSRAWKHYDFGITTWPDVRPQSAAWLKGLLHDPRAVRFFIDLFDRIHANIDAWGTWASQWNYACFTHHGLGIRPYTNLVKYIGLDDATHRYQWGSSNAAELPVRPVGLPLKHPPCLLMDPEADRLNYDRMLSALQHTRRIDRLKQPLRKARSLLQSATRACFPVQVAASKAAMMAGAMG